MAVDVLHTLTTGGITLLGVLLSIGVTVGFGVSGPLWVRLLAGLATTLALVVIVKLGTSEGRGPLARAANWTIGGATQLTVKKECGARLSTPSAEREDTQAIGRGSTTEVKKR